MRRAKRNCTFSEAVFEWDKTIKSGNKYELCHTHGQGTLRGGDFGLRCPLHGAVRIGHKLSTALEPQYFCARNVQTKYKTKKREKIPLSMDFSWKKV